ncbi:MAG: S8 family serine peptidase [Anaerolineae bacterium]|nr:S8 family serine peptidase [Anaerolineae bacterium]
MRRRTWLRSLSLVVLLLTLLPLNARSIVEARQTPPESAQPQNMLLLQEEPSAITARITPSTPLAPPPIRLVIGSFTPTLGESLDVPPDLRAGFSATQPADGYYLVQFKGPIEEGWKTAVQNAGGILFDYIPDFTFISYMDTGALERVQALPEVLWIGPYEPAYKLSPDLADAAGILDLNVQTFPDDSRSNLTNQFEALDARIKDASEQSTGGLFRMSIEAAQLHALAKIPAVRWIEPFYERVLFNDVARSDLIMDAESVWADLGLYGAGQVVAVTDTGLDTGNTTTLHQDFRGAPTGCTGTNRVVATFALGRTGDWSDSCGTSSGGHGTHVTGSVLGNGCMSGSNGMPNYGTSYAGLAPQASLVFQSVMDSACGLGGLPMDLNDLYSQAYAEGARIHTNSWGAGVNGQYTMDSYNTDLYSWNHKDYTILFAASNDGVDKDSNGVVDLDSLGAPGTAKNCVTVGATENNRPYGGINPEHAGDLWDEVQCSGNGGGGGWGNCWPADFPVAPIVSDLISNNSSGMAAFSSRGPTDDGRTKPDIVAPGSNILSTKSQGTYVSTGWGPGENQ